LNFEKVLAELHEELGVVNEAIRSLERLQRGKRRSRHSAAPPEKQAEQPRRRPGERTNHKEA